ERVGESRIADGHHGRGEARRDLAHLLDRTARREELDARRARRGRLLRENRTAHADDQTENRAPRQRPHRYLRLAHWKKSQAIFSIPRRCSHRQKARLLPATSPRSPTPGRRFQYAEGDHGNLAKQWQVMHDARRCRSAHAWSWASLPASQSAHCWPRWGVRVSIISL